MNRIDADTEETFRKVLYAAIKDDEKSFEEQLNAFVTDDALIVSCARATDVAGLVIADQYKGRPTPEMVTRLADYAASFNEEWSGITSAQFGAFINAMLAGAPVEEVLSVGAAVRVPFVLAGHLLVQFHASDETAFDYLDRIWEELESRN